ncbi:MAG: hypothetical protein IJU82_08575 [Ruminiclostridium sp.]|nr:hypothetical protein [Ruminiclostridium sp.]
MKKDRDMYFWLALYGKNVDYRKIEEKLHIKPDNNRIDAPDDLPEYPDRPIFYKEIAWLLDLIENNKNIFLDSGVVFSESQIWMLYYYDKQCNMEFDAGLMKRMGDLGLKLCVSCEG